MAKPNLDQDDVDSNDQRLKALTEVEEQELFRTAIPIPNPQVNDEEFKALEGVLSRRFLLGPVIIAALLFGPPVIFCMLFFGDLGKGHPPGAIIPVLYLFFVTPVLAPLGFVLTVWGIRRADRYKWLLWSLGTVFLVLTLAACTWFARYFIA